MNLHRTKREHMCWLDRVFCFVSGAWGRGEPALWRAGRGQESRSTPCLPAPDSPCRLWCLPGDRGARCFCSCRNSQREGHPKSVQVSWFTGTAHTWSYVCACVRACVRVCLSLCFVCWWGGKRAELEGHWNWTAFSITGYNSSYVLT